MAALCERSECLWGPPTAGRALASLPSPRRGIGGSQILMLRVRQRLKQKRQRRRDKIAKRFLARRLLSLCRAEQQGRPSARSGFGGRTPAPPLRGPLPFDPPGREAPGGGREAAAGWRRTELEEAPEGATGNAGSEGSWPRSGGAARHAVPPQGAQRLKGVSLERCGPSRPARSLVRPSGERRRRERGFGRSRGARRRSGELHQA